MEQQEQGTLPHGMVCVNDRRFSESERATLRALYLAGWKTVSEIYPGLGQSCDKDGVTTESMEALMRAANFPIERPKDRPPQIIDRINLSNGLLKGFTLAVHLVAIPPLDPSVARVRGDIVTGVFAISEATAARLREQYPELDHWSISDFQLAWGHYAREWRGAAGIAFERDEVFLVYLYIAQKYPTYSFTGDRSMPGNWEAYAQEKPWETDAPLPPHLSAGD